MNNDALKHNVRDHGREKSNGIWTELLSKLKFYDNTHENHNLFLRTRWVLGAAEWLAGCHGSKQNEKESFLYSDKEWNWIWETMLEDCAWSVPGIKDVFGNVVKENLAPELLIKYIAHDLQCHIITIDLVLRQVQFCSANHLKANNALFDSPIIIYCTGNHFQAVFPKNQEYFIKYAEKLEERNNSIPLPSSSLDTPSTISSNNTSPKAALKSNTEENKQSQPITSFPSSSNSNKNFKKPSLHVKKAKISKRTETLEISNKFQCLTSDDNSNSDENITPRKKVNSKKLNEETESQKTNEYGGKYNWVS